MIQALACDLDGTLVPTGGRIAPSDVAALVEAGRLGVRRVLVTGRPSRCLDDVPDVVALFERTYACNGAEAVAPDGRVMVRHALTAAQALDVTTHIRRLLPDAAFAVEYGTHFSYEPRYSYWPATDRWPDSVEAPIFSLLTGSGPLLKLLVKTDLPTAELVRLILAAFPRLTVTHSNPQGVPGPVEILAGGATKANVVREFADSAGIGLGDFAAFGDRLNDLPMLRIVGHPVAVGAADQPDLAAFEQVATAPADGVGGWLRRWPPLTRVPG